MRFENFGICFFFHYLLKIKCIKTMIQTSFHIDPFYIGTKRPRKFVFYGDPIFIYYKLVYNLIYCLFERFICSRRHYLSNCVKKSIKLQYFLYKFYKMTSHTPCFHAFKLQKTVFIINKGFWAKGLKQGLKKLQF